jgi:hypothetical protein
MAGWYRLGPGEVEFLHFHNSAFNSLLARQIMLQQ